MEEGCSRNRLFGCNVSLWKSSKFWRSCLVRNLLVVKMVQSGLPLTKMKVFKEYGDFEGVGNISMSSQWEVKIVSCRICFVVECGIVGAGVVAIATAGTFECHCVYLLLLSWLLLLLLSLSRVLLL